MQTLVLKRTCESILVDCRGRREWLEEEESELMDQLESNSVEPEESDQM